MPPEGRLDFPIYGLGAAWTGPRMVGVFQADPDGSVTEIALEHWAHADDPMPVIRVETLPLGRFVEQTHAGGDVLRELAYRSVLCLTDRAMPDLPDGPRSHIRHHLRALEDAWADDHANWRTVTWSVDKSPVTARVLTWGGGWTGFTTDVAEVAISVVSSEPIEDLMLDSIGDGSAYHFDAAGPLRWPEVAEQSRRAALGGEPDSIGEAGQPDATTFDPQALHPDLRAILDLPAPVPEPEPVFDDPAALTELKAYFAWLYRCNTWDADDPAESGRVHARCECDELTGWFDSYESAQRAIERHQDGNDAETEAFLTEFRSRHPLREPGVLRGEHWSVALGARRR